MEANKHNNSTTVYYLLLKKHIQAGGIVSPEYRPFSRHKMLNQTLNAAVQEEDLSLIFQNVKSHKSRRTESTGGTDSKKESLYEKMLTSQLKHERHISAEPPKRFHSFSPNSHKIKNSITKKVKACTPRPPSIYTIKNVKAKDRSYGKAGASPIHFPNYRIKSDRRNILIRNK